MIQKTRKKKKMNKEEIEKIIKEYLKENLRIEPKVKYVDAYSSPENFLEVYLGNERIQVVSLYEFDF